MSAHHFDRNQLRLQLEAGLEKLTLSLDALQIEQLLNYVQMLVKWGGVFNLTAILAPDKILVKHLLDSLAIANYLPDGDCLDVGTGAGLPGIPLAIVYPNKRFCLVDSNSKKIRFVRQVLIELKLTNVELRQERIEQLGALVEHTCYSSIVSRAFSSLKFMLEQCYSLKSPEGFIIAMKGKVTENEIGELAQLPIEPKRVVVERIAVPFLEEERHLVIIQ